MRGFWLNIVTFLSIQAQDFIEEEYMDSAGCATTREFLSIQAQDFIEEPSIVYGYYCQTIPEHSSSGLH